MSTKPPMQPEMGAQREARSEPNTTYGGYTLGELREMHANAQSAAGPWRAIPWFMSEDQAEVRTAEGWLMCCLPSDAYATLIASSYNALPDLLTALEQASASAERQAGRIRVLEAMLSETRAYMGAKFDGDPKIVDLGLRIRRALSGEGNGN